MGKHHVVPNKNRIRGVKKATRIDDGILANLNFMNRVAVKSEVHKELAALSNLNLHHLSVPKKSKTVNRNSIHHMIGEIVFEIKNELFHED